jgi:biopolymer transport protein ExbD
MSLPRIELFNRRSDSGSFNMTPVIDIVFLLIIFFLVVCQFVEAENFSVVVPDRCDAAQTTVEPGLQLTTVTVMKAPDGQIVYAVGSQTMAHSDEDLPANVVERLAKLIDEHIKDLPTAQKVVTLRVDKGIQYGDAQYALAAIAKSTATDVQLSVVKGELQSDQRLQQP